MRLYAVADLTKKIDMENEIINTDKSSLEPRKPLLLKADVISRFYSCLA
jgi:hypothetical protein